jgi:hypothetical protein
VARAFLWIGEHGRPVPAAPAALATADLAALEAHWTAKLRLLPGLMHTPTGARLASARAGSIRTFLTGLREELAGSGIPRSSDPI